MSIQNQKTFVMIKPDAVERQLIGAIISRFEDRGLRVTRLEMADISPEFIDGHYPKDAAWITRLGRKMIDGFQAHGINARELYGTDDPVQLGPMVRQWLLDYFTMGSVVKMIIEGPEAVAAVRKIVGATMPFDAALGTIRGDFSTDSAVSANGSGRVVHNLVHASETPDEAEHEIKYWFGDGSKKA